MTDLEQLALRVEQIAPTPTGYISCIETEIRQLQRAVEELRDCLAAALRARSA